MTTNSLKPYQLKGIEFLAGRRHALLADDMGLGKTAQVIKAIEVVKAEKVLIICPASVKLSWRDEIHKWYGLGGMLQVINSSKDLVHPRAKFVIVNYDLVIKPHIYKQLILRRWDVGVADEAHMLKKTTAKRTKAVLSTKGIFLYCHYRWCVTGTPIENKPIDLFPILVSLNGAAMGKYADETRFAYHFCNASPDGYGSYLTNGISHPEELKAMLQGFMLRRKKEDVLKELPPKIFQTVKIPLTKEIEKVKNELEKEYLNVELTDIEELGLFVKMKRLIAEAKLPYVLEHIKNVMNEKKKVVVFGVHRNLLMEIKNELPDTFLVRGGMTPQEKQDQIEGFKQAESGVFIGNIQAAGQGINGLQEVCDTVVFVEVDLTPGRMNQAVDRLHRIGQKGDSVLIQFFVVENTLEESVVKSLENKQKINDQIV